MTAHSWLWPDRIIGKRESRRLRDEHNALINNCAALERALVGVADNVRAALNDDSPATESALNLLVDAECIAREAITLHGLPIISEVPNV